MVCWIFRHARVQHPVQYTFEFIPPASPDRNGVIFIALSHVEAEMWTIVIFLSFKSVALIAWLTESTWSTSGNVLQGDGLPDTVVSAI